MVLSSNGTHEQQESEKIKISVIYSFNLINSNPPVSSVAKHIAIGAGGVGFDSWAA